MAVPGMGRGNVGQGMGSLSLELEFPQSVATHDDYAEAQKAVDFLSDKGFPVENLMICGTDLKLIERVTGRRSWGSVIAGGALNGVFTGLLIGLLFSFFAEPGMLGPVFALGIGLAVVFNIIMSAISYAATGGRRDFNSITQTVPTRFEILCEHKHAARARELLMEMPGARAKLFE
ncbi:general stress protein [Propioniferax innocua]|uniref:General stress protein 17M-like domain-containing protein n=1 Tax=Propioniferax innocua TaxID=1753 RepID=A0A542ZRC4_9ACTN|nr:hypothetical protein FB460_0697 [Propioniferax innocua]